MHDHFKITVWKKKKKQVCRLRHSIFIFNLTTIKINKPINRYIWLKIERSHYLVSQKQKQGKKEVRRRAHSLRKWWTRRVQQTLLYIHLIHAFMKRNETDRQKFIRSLQLRWIMVYIATVWFWSRAISNGRYAPLAKQTIMWKCPFQKEIIDVIVFRWWFGHFCLIIWSICV